MFSKIIVGVDGGPDGADALALAEALAAPGSDLVLVHVWEPQAGVAAAALGQRPPHLAAEALLEKTARAAGRPCRVLALEADTIAAGLHHAARQERAELLVIGSSSRGAAGRLLLGDDLGAELHDIHCGVAIAPGGLAGGTVALRHVGVGYQDSEEGRAAFATAHAVAEEQGAELEAVYVLTPVPEAAGPYADVAVLGEGIGSREHEAERHLATLPGARACVVRGQVAEQLVRASERLDLLVLGSRGTGAVGRLLFGSTVEAVVRAAACPVLVVPRPEVPVEPTTAAVEAAVERNVRGKR